MKNLFRVQSSKFKVQGSRFKVQSSNPEHGTRNTEHAAAAWALGAMLALMPAIAAAQAMNDPTRPPGAYVTGDPDAGGDAGGGLVLQSVMISRDRKAAIINGEMVRLGEKYGDAVLVKVVENEVVLKSGDTTQVLKMYPGVEKRYAPPVAAKRAPRVGKKPRSEPDAGAPGGASPR